MTTAALYARFSSDLQRDASIEDQLRLCHDLAAREGCATPEIFVDRALSAASMARPGLQALLEACRSGRIDLVIAESIDRLSRDLADMAEISRQLRYLGVRLITAEEGEVSTLQVAFSGLKAEMDLKGLAAKTHRGLVGKIRDGLSGGGIAYGYRPDPDGPRGARRIEPAEAAIIRQILERFAAGESAYVIARGLNQAGVPGPGGRRWAQNTIAGNRARGIGILNNEMYVGRLVWNRQRFIKHPATGKRQARPNPPEKWLVEDVPHLRIVDDGLWRAVKDRQDAGRAPRQAVGRPAFWRRRRPRHALSGLLRCGCCGGTFVRRDAKAFACAAARASACDNTLSIRVDLLERTIAAGLRTHLLTPARFAAFSRAFIEESNRALAELNARRDQAEAEMAQVVRKLDRIVDAVLDGAPHRQFHDRMTALESRRDALERMIADVPPRQAFTHPNTAEIYRQTMEDLESALGSSDAEAIELVQQLIDRVDLVPVDGELRIDLHGRLAGLLAVCGQAKAPSLRQGLDRQIKLVAGARNTFDLAVTIIGLPRIAA